MKTQQTWQEKMQGVETSTGQPVALPIKRKTLDMGHYDEKMNPYPAQAETGAHSPQVVFDHWELIRQRDESRAHAEQLAEALKHWQDWADGKRAWPKLETNEALAQWEQH